MPIMTPLADLLGITRQTAVLAFNFGDGFCNYVLPTSTALMGIISAANIPVSYTHLDVYKRQPVHRLTG